jgi:crotonobetainyl-CoA:carnitine CoA-transferase CaiB-like acyl-CoA transferase
LPSRESPPHTPTSYQTGKGQIVDTSLLEAAAKQTYWHAAIHFATGARRDERSAPH